MTKLLLTSLSSQRQPIDTTRLHIADKLDIIKCAQSLSLRNFSADGRAPLRSIYLGSQP
jgi:hypothetical protein